MTKSCSQDSFFTKKSRERWDTCYCEASKQEKNICNRHLLSHTSHRRQIIIVHMVDHRSCCKKQQRLEHGMREQMKHRRSIAKTFFAAISGNTKRKHHETDLRHRGICKDAFDVSLRACNYCRKQS